MNQPNRPGTYYYEEWASMAPSEYYLAYDLLETAADSWDIPLTALHVDVTQSEWMVIVDKEGV